jgi:hypothetical protein
MNWLKDMFAGTGEGIFKGLTDLTKVFKEGSTEAMQLRHAVDMAEIQYNTVMAQIQAKINEIEAAHTNLFVSGWRPFVGWVCGASFAYAVILNDFINWIAAVAGLPAFPEPDTTLTLEILMCLLGIAGYRSYEKTKGVAAK